MKINGIEMQYQSDPRYSNEVMTFPKWQPLPDRIGDYGCLVTAKLNCFNLFKKDKKHYNLKELNDILIQNFGYKYLYYMRLLGNDLNLVKKECFQKESETVNEVINLILGIKHEEYVYTEKIDISIPNIFYIVRTIYQNTGHYSMVLDNDLSYCDSYNAKYHKPENILNIIKITF